MPSRFLIPALLLLAVAACRDAPTAVTGPSPPSVVTLTGPRADLLADPLTVLIAGQLAKNPTGLRTGLQLSSPDEPLDSADVRILQAALELILQTADSLPADTGTGGH